MAIGGTIEAKTFALQQHNMSRNLSRGAVTVPVVALMGGAAVMGIEPRYGLFSAALILGWTQLVGL